MRQHSPGEMNMTHMAHKASPAPPPALKTRGRCVIREAETEGQRVSACVFVRVQQRITLEEPRAEAAFEIVVVGINI